MYALTKDQSTSLTINVNGETCQMDTADRTLLEVLREDFRLTGTKKACDNGECGSCIVMMNGKPTKSCLLKANRAADRDVMTIEGMAPAAKGIKAGEDISILHPIQQAFLEKGATQCGFCIPGMIMKTANLLQNKPNPTRNEIVKSLSKNLCRCTGYTKILDAVEYAAELINDGRSGVSQGVGDGPAVGGNVSRLDSPGTVTGDAMYAGDMQMDGMLHARLLRSTQHHARIISIDTSEAEAMEGVECVVTADDIPGTPFLPNCQPQVYVFPKDRIRFKGEAIAGVAACTEAIAEEALKKIKVVVEELPHAIEIVDAMRKNAEPMYNHSPRVSPPEEVSCGNIEAGFAKADVIIQNDYTVPVREHAAMEPESALVYMDGRKLVCITGLYHAFVQGTESIANNLAMKQEDVRIKCPAMGGNFGTRGDTLIAVACGLMTQKTGKPIRMVFSREESILGSCKAPSVDIRYKTGAMKDGRIIAVDVEVLHGAGGWAPFLIAQTTKGRELCFYETLGALLSHVTGPYEIENVRGRAWDVLTNGPRYVPLRGTNANYLPLAYESQVDLVAEALGLDPLDVRMKNAIRIGSKTHFGQTLNEHVSMVKELELLKPHYEAAKIRLEVRRANAESPWMPGLGMGSGWRNIGYLKTSITAGAELTELGEVHVMAGTVEQGQGPTTQFAQIAADQIGVSMSEMKVTLGDTDAAPYPVPTFSSISTVGTGKAVQMAAEKLKDKLLEGAAEMLQSSKDNLKVKGNKIFLTAFPDTAVTLTEIAQHFAVTNQSSLSEAEIPWSGEAPTILYGYNTGLMELDVNTETGAVRLLNHVNVCDPGTRINPQAVDGQIDGAIAFGVGFALSERFHPDNPATLEGYGLPSTKRIPSNVTRLYVEDPLERGPFGAKSMAEHPGISPIPAIINGIANATGARVRDIPATPDRVLQALMKIAAE
ncbi:molybdopterin-dependent oxidoreductase [Amylibacter sp.]|jgi:aldehyde oxidoreductase|nr:molybdopterin-dependent oxidoreductase [Amylibacter sp.]MDB9814396.1 molybdopterin-dependent oxidoreductase [Amylibacter sp.]|tara:strand:- start:3806 stop:6622 length:2817 start_codon:yes stop_codon:yes gene_type:complete